MVAAAESMVKPGTGLPMYHGGYSGSRLEADTPAKNGVSTPGRPAGVPDPGWRAGTGAKELQGDIDVHWHVVAPLKPRVAVADMDAAKIRLPCLRQKHVVDVVRRVLERAREQG